MQQATNFLNDSTVQVEPIPGNQGAAGNTFGFGDRAGLVAFGGNIIPVYASNLNTSGSNIYTAFVTTAAGPRIIYGDQGPITAEFTAPITTGTTAKPITSGIYTYNNTYASDGTEQFSGFVIQFDRAILASSFMSADVTVQYQNPNTGQVYTLPVGSITPLDEEEGFGPNDGNVDGVLASTFAVNLKNPQTAVGTYSYSIAGYQVNGAAIQDSMRNITYLGAAMNATQTSMFVTSNIGFSLATPFYIQVDNEEMEVTNASTNSWTVIRGGVNGTTATAHNAESNGAGGVVTTYGNLMDQNANTMTGEPAVATATTLNFGNSVPSLGLRTTMTVASSAGFPAVPFVVQVDSEQIEVIGESGTNNTIWTVRRGFNNTTEAPFGHAKGATVVIINEPDAYSIPTPVNGVPFTAPYNDQTLPIIIPGPHVVATSVPVNGAFTQGRHHDRGDRDTEDEHHDTCRGVGQRLSDDRAPIRNSGRFGNHGGDGRQRDVMDRRPRLQQFDCRSSERRHADAPTTRRT